MAICLRQSMASFCIGLHGRFGKICGRAKSLRIDVPIYAENESAEALCACAKIR